MNNVIEHAVDTFSSIVRFDKEDGQWIAENIKEIMTDLYNINPGSPVFIQKYVKEKFGEDKIKVVITKLTPYMSGPYGVLDMTYEDKDGKLVSLTSIRNWLEDETEEGKKYIVDGEQKYTPEEVLVVFRRNERM